MLEFLETIRSQTENVTKFLFRCGLDKSIIEFSYINKGDGKDIICVPSETMCTLGCKFCHTTDYIGKLKCRTLYAQEIVDGVNYVYNYLKLIDAPKTLLISFMGCGEPMRNYLEIVKSMLIIRTTKKVFTRFAVATCLPKTDWSNFFDFAYLVHKEHLQVKLHISLHYTMDQIRRHWMPAALDVIPTLSAANFYKEVTSNAVEIHYALIDGINDTEQDAILLTSLIKNKGFNVKFLFYNEKDSLKIKASPKEKISIFKKYFDRYGIESEYYVPPGLDVGASCGQFLFDYYEKFKIE